MTSVGEDEVKTSPGRKTGPIKSKKPPKFNTKLSLAQKVARKAAINKKVDNPVVSVRHTRHPKRKNVKDGELLAEGDKAKLISPRKAIAIKSKTQKVHPPKSRTKVIRKKPLEKNSPQKDGEDPFPGPAPLPAKRLKKHKRGDAENLQKGVISKEKKIELNKTEQGYQYSAEQAARAELLLSEDVGYLQPDKDQFTAHVTQAEIKRSVDITSATKQFDLSLKFGPYAISYLRNGRKLVMGGRMGHVAAFDWVTKDLLCEMNVMESVYDVTWLHNESFFAVAQKDWTYIYDNQGIELHCVKKMHKPLKLEFLPYHFLLASSSEKSYLTWLDVSIGKVVRSTYTNTGRMDVMCQNPYNAVLACGHPGGTVTMWTPNVQSPVVKMLCHEQAVRAVTIDQRGIYMATSAADATLKIWDLRTFNCLQSYRMGCGASNLAFSQKNLIAASLGNIVEVYKDMCTETIRYPYLKHQVGSSVSGVEFCPYEDVLGVGHASGMCSMLVPGAGEPNFDAYEANPFQTKSQRQESEVKSLLEKIQPELITLDPMELAEVDRTSAVERFKERTKHMFYKPPAIDVKPKKNASSAKQYKIKKHLQGEHRREQAEVAKKRKSMLESEEKVPRQGVLDRFKAKPSKPKAKKAA